MPILDNVLGLLEETAADGQRVREVLGDDIKGFCSALAGEEGAKSYRDKWRAHMARVKALPQDYQIVYKEIQKYLFKIGPVELTEGTGLLSGIVDLFKGGAARGKGVLEVTGRDVAAFCDDLIKDSKTYADNYQESVDREVK